jgi:hypothetical protein
LFVPRISKIKKKYAVDLNEVACQFAFNMEKDCVAYGFIATPKFEKHILAVDYNPAEHGSKESTKEWGRLGIVKPQEDEGKHTVITPAGFGAIRPLYEFFAKDFIREFRKQKVSAWNAEFEYTRQELGRHLPGGKDIKKDAGLDDFQYLYVGAIVKDLAANDVRQSPVAGPKKEDGTITIVYFGHGPFVSKLPKK